MNRWRSKAKIQIKNLKINKTKQIIAYLCEDRHRLMTEIWQDSAAYAAASNIGL